MRNRYVKLASVKQEFILVFPYETVLPIFEAPFFFSFLFTLPGILYLEMIGKNVLFVCFVFSLKIRGGSVHVRKFQYARY